MSHFKVSRRHPNGVHQTDHRNGIYCHGEGEPVPGALAEFQHPGFKSEKLEVRHVAIIATTEALASQWVDEIIAGCKSVISDATEHFSSLNLYALWTAENLEGMCFDEVHIAITESMTSTQIDQFRSHTRHLYLHEMPTHKCPCLKKSRTFEWALESDFTAFLSSLFSVQEAGLWVAGSWEGFNQATINSSSLRVISSQEPELSDSLNCLLDQLGKSTISKRNHLLLIVRGNKKLTMGDLVIAHDTITAHFPDACELSVVLDRNVTTEGYKVMLLLDSSSCVIADQAGTHGGDE